MGIYRNLSKSRNYLLFLGICFISTLFLLIGFFAIGSEKEILPFLLTYLFIGLIMVPIVKQHNKGQFNLFQPLIWASFIFFFPCFVFKVWAIIFLKSPSYGLSLVTDEPYYLTLSLIFAILAYVSFLIGYYLPFGRSISRHLPSFSSWNWKARNLKIPSTFIYFIGFAATFYLFYIGIYAYSVYEGRMTFINILQNISDFRLVGAFLAFYAFFASNKEYRRNWIPILSIIYLGELWWQISRGSRGNLFWFTICIVAAYQFAKYDQITLRRFVRPIFVIILALVFGMIVGTSFRKIKLAGFGHDQIYNISDTLYICRNLYTELTKQSPKKLAEKIYNDIIVRLDSVGNLAVIIAYSPQLKSLERMYGMDNNIVKELLWGFVPRFIWPKKPIINTTRSFYILYMQGNLKIVNYSAITIIGDLYRNFGLYGVVFGMMLLGVLLRMIYSWLIECRKPEVVHALFYYFLLTSTRYEEAYSGFFLVSIRRFVFLILAAVIIQLIIHRKN